MFFLEGVPLIAHFLSALLVLGLISIACIGAYAKKRRLLSLGLLLLSFSGGLWVLWSGFPDHFFHSTFYELSPSLSYWFVPLLNLLEAAGWGCVLVGVFKLPKPEVSS